MQEILKQRSNSRLSASSSQCGLPERIKSENERANLQSENSLLRRQVDSLFSEIQDYKHSLSILQQELEDTHEQKDSSIAVMADEINKLRAQEEDFNS